MRPSNNSIFNIYVCWMFLHSQNNWRVQLVYFKCENVIVTVVFWELKTDFRPTSGSASDVSVPNQEEENISAQVENLFLPHRQVKWFTWSQTYIKIKGDYVSFDFSPVEIIDILLVIVNNLLSPPLFTTVVSLLMITVKEHLLILLRVANKHYKQLLTFYDWRS